MLFCLTAPFRAGKTRALEKLCSYLESRDIVVYGVISPGIWEKRAKNSYIKTGIESVVYPNKQRVKIADASPEGGWDFDEQGIELVNQYIKANKISCNSSKQSLLIIDELGPLELIYNQGFVSCIELLQKGPQPPYEDALVVVRPSLQKVFSERFESIWTNIQYIEPKDIEKFILNN